jgi:Tol biopolymer transport system component
MATKGAKFLGSKIWISGAFIAIAVLAGAGVAYSGMAADAPSVEAARVSILQVTHDGISKSGLLADDANLYVTESPAARHVVAKVKRQGTRREILAAPFSNYQALDLSADGKTLLVSTTAPGGAGDAEFWTIPLGNGKAQRIGSLTGRDAAWSADGKLLTFTKGESLYIANANGSDVHEVYKAPGSIFSPRFSPDSSAIRFTLSDATESTTSLWEVQRDGSKAHTLLPGWSNASASCCGRWTSDGRYYIFQVTQASPATITTLWALPSASGPGGVVPFRLTSGPMSLGNVSPTKDVNKFLAIGVAPSAEAVRYDATTKTFMPVLNGVSATDLNFSADGKWATYVSIPEGTLWRCRVDGSDKLQLSTDRVALPQWSPDASQISYVDTTLGRPSRILLISRDGGTPREMLAEERGQIDANWSADGSSIMYGYLWNDPKMNIRVVNMKTHEVSSVPGSDGFFSPRWSPNGKYIAALSPDFTKVMLFDFATQKWTIWLTEAAGAVSYPVWSADSNYLYFDDLVTDEESIRRVKVGEHSPEAVLVLSGIERYPGAFGLWLGQAPDGSWLFVRDRSTQEVYQLTMQLP